MDRVETGTFSYTGDLLSWSKEGVGVVGHGKEKTSNPNPHDHSRAKDGLDGTERGRSSSSCVETVTTGHGRFWSGVGVGVVACKPSIVTDPDCPSPSRSKAAAVGLDP